MQCDPNDNGSDHDRDPATRLEGSEHARRVTRSPEPNPGVTVACVNGPLQIVIFGASGDLTRRKLVPAIAAAAAARPERPVSVVGVARRPMTDDEFRAQLRGALGEADRPAFEALAPQIFYCAADASVPDDLARLQERLGELAGGHNVGRLFYLALAPSLFGVATEQLVSAGLLDRRSPKAEAFRRLIIEKPFGHDLASARELNAHLHSLLHEEQIYRIDHYLGKETVQNLLGFRFHNSIFEPLWNRHHVELVQITVAEDIGVEQGRAGYYDKSGALRDMLQNHMLQILALVAMEPPVSMEAEAVRDEKVQVLRGLICPEGTKNIVRARYGAGPDAIGYVEEEGVPADSTTETYVAIRAEIDNWRWAGVPFLLRHGKRMARKFTEVVVQFRTPPVPLFNRPGGMDYLEYRRRLRDGELCQMRPNVLTLSIQPRETIELSFGVKRPGSDMLMAPARLAFDYREHFENDPAPAYERLLADALAGDQTLFLRADEIEASWRFADGVRGAWETDPPPPLYEYPAGGSGPAQAEALFYGCEGGWTSA